MLNAKITYICHFDREIGVDGLNVDFYRSSLSQMDVYNVRYVFVILSFYFQIL